MTPQLDLGMSNYGLQHAECADPATLDGGAAQLGAGSGDEGKARISQGAVAYFQGFQASHAGNL